jgi:RimJ/RimL family protein N-acetyltransferase
MPLPLKTDRLLLRPPTLGDLPAWHATYVDAEKAWFGAPRSSIDENREKLVRQVAHHEQHGFGFCVVELLDGGEIIGAAGLQHLEGGPEVEVGYRFLEQQWGRGYATESALASLDFGFRELGLNRIVAVALETNVASRRVLEKCRMQEVGLTHVYGLEHVKYELGR